MAVGASGVERRCRHSENSRKMAFGRRRDAAVTQLWEWFGPNPARRRWPISWPWGCNCRLVHRLRDTATVKQKGGVVVDDFVITFEGRGRRRDVWHNCVHAIEWIKVIFRPYHTARTVENKTQRSTLACSHSCHHHKIAMWCDGYAMPDNNKACPGYQYLTSFFLTLSRHLSTGKRAV